MKQRLQNNYKMQAQNTACTVKLHTWAKYMYLATQTFVSLIFQQIDPEHC